jgi:hypothetical protein
MNGTVVKFRSSCPGRSVIRRAIAAGCKANGAVSLGFAVSCAALLLAGCGSGRAAPAKQRRAGVRASGGIVLGGKIPASLLAGVRPIGRGPRFQPPVSGAVPGRCLPALGVRLASHIEVFGANRVVLLAAGIGTAGPREFRDGRLTNARCFGDVVTLDPTGTVYFRERAGVTLGTVFRAWGETLTATRVASFTGGRTLAYVDGREWHGSPASLPLTSGAEIVVEIGPHVPPHRHFTFTPLPSKRIR